MMEAKILKTEAEYEAVLARIDELMDAAPDSPEEEELELLALLVEKYEAEHYPIELPDPVEAIKFRMEQEGLSRKDLIPYIGSQSKVSEVLNYKRSLSLAMIRSLNEGMGIPAEVLLQDYDENLEANAPGWRDFPFNELLKRGFFDDFAGTLVEARTMAGDLLRDLFSVFGDMQYSPIYCKRGDREVDINSLMAWQARVLHMVLNQELPNFTHDKITDDFIQQVVKLSYFSSGPQIAAELLAKNGIHFTVLRHLPNTYLDGACFYAPDQHPVIGMTLRFDRLDNFWFTLVHELAHLYLHLDERQTVFFDDTENPHGDQIRPEEEKANEFARNMLISPEIWGDVSDELIHTDDDELLIDVAEKLKIHRAIVAGRVRWETQDFKRFTSLVGQGDVRPQFSAYI